MSQMGNNAIQAQIEANRTESAVVRIGDEVAGTGNSALLYSDSSGNTAETGVTASQPVYIDSSSVPQTGSIPFATTMAGLVVSGLLTTTVSALDVTGTSSNSADLLMQGQLVQGSQVTTFTTTGFIQVNLTDSGGNLTDGVHYLRVGTLT